MPSIHVTFDDDIYYNISIKARSRGISKSKIVAEMINHAYKQEELIEQRDKYKKQLDEVIADYNKLMNEYETFIDSQKEAEKPPLNVEIEETINVKE